MAINFVTVEDVRILRGEFALHVRIRTRARVPTCSPGAVPGPMKVAVGAVVASAPAHVLARAHAADIEQYFSTQIDEMPVNIQDLA